MKLKHRIHNLYNNLGPAGQSIVAYSYSFFPLRLRKKRGFWGYLKFLRNSQWESPEWHREHQSLQLKSLAKFAVSTTYYYQKLFEKNQIYPAQLSSPEELSVVPILQKDTLVKKINEFLPIGYPTKNLKTNSTSGSTGEPFKFFQDYSAVMREEAFAVRHWENAGMKLGEPCVYLRSYVPQNENETNYFDPVNNRHYFSAYHLDGKNLEFYCKKIADSRAQFIFGYPSSLEILSDYLISAGKSLSIKAAITGSEMLSDNARLKIEKALGTKVFDWYGLAEPTVTMGQCQKGNYHLFAEYGILELLDAGNNPVTQEGQTGRIIATNFTNRALPLIRYDTGDLGTFTAQKCNCGRGLPVIVSSILGRKDDLLVGSNGQYLPSVNFYSLFAKMGGEVSRFQLIQKDATKFKLKLVRGPEFGEQSVKNIVEGLNQRIGGRPQILIETVEKISPSRAGKIRAVIRDYVSVGEKGGIMKIDFHLHTRASFDCDSDPIEIINWAHKKGLNCLAVTDHDTTDGYSTFKEAADQKGIFVIPGVELTVSRGTHYLVYLTPELPLPLDDLKMIDEVHRRGGLVGIPHPYRSDTGLMYNQEEKRLYDASEVAEILWRADFIEILNAKSSSEQNEKALELSKRHPQLKPIAGSDSHHPATIGAAHCELSEFRYSTLEGMARMLKNIEINIVALSELDESISSKSVRRAVEGIRRLMVKVKPAVPNSIWEIGKSIYRSSFNRLAEKRASKSLTKN